MTEEERADLVKVITESLSNEFDKRKRIDEETHWQHHEFIAMRIDEVAEAKALREDVKKKVIGWAAIVSIGATITLIGQGLVQQIQNLFKG